MQSAISFNLEHSKMLSSGNWLNIVRQQILACLKLTEFRCGKTEESLYIC